MIASGVVEDVPESDIQLAFNSFDILLILDGVLSKCILLLFGI